MIRMILSLIIVISFVWGSLSLIKHHVDKIDVEEYQQKQLDIPDRSDENYKWTFKDHLSILCFLGFVIGICSFTDIGNIIGIILLIIGFLFFL